MFDSCEIRIHPTGKAIARFGTKSQGQATRRPMQIIAEELGIPAAHVEIEEGDTDTAPYGSARMRAARRRPRRRGGDGRSQDPREAKKIAAYLLEVSEADLVWEPGKFSVKGAPQSRRRSRTSPSRPTPTTRKGWKRGWRRSTTTIRRT
jgi:carbon-monoxide dehydrogenase large subunit